MSAAAAGKRLQNTEDDVTNALRGGVVTAPVDTETAGQGDVVAKQFPRKFDAGTERWDRVTALKQQLVTPGTSSTPFGDLQFSDRDAMALLKKDEALKQADFDSWFARKFHRNDLPSRVFAQKINPTFYKEREALMVERAKVALRIKLIELRGPKDEKDLQIVYGLQTGDIRLDPGWDTIGFTEGYSAETQSARLKRDVGLASRMFVRPGQAVNDADAANTGFAAFASNPFSTGTAPSGVATGLRDAGMRSLIPGPQ